MNAPADGGVKATDRLQEAPTARVPGMVHVPAPTVKARESAPETGCSVSSEIGSGPGLESVTVPVTGITGGTAEVAPKSCSSGETESSVPATVPEIGTMTVLLAGSLLLNSTVPAMTSPGPKPPVPVLKDADPAHVPPGGMGTPVQPEKSTVKIREQSHGGS